MDVRVSGETDTLVKSRQTMKKENIYKDLTDATKSLLDMAKKDLSFNNISDNCLYIISEIRHSDKNLFERNKIRIKANSLKTPKLLTNILPDLEVLYPNFYDVNLYVYRADKQVTIIEIQYYPRSSLDIECRQKTQSQETMLHCKVSNPLYYPDTKEKFDINWEFEPLNHKWKMFWWRRKTSKYLKSRDIKV
jgi:hypothetical protein